MSLSSFIFISPLGFTDRIGFLAHQAYSQDENGLEMFLYIGLAIFNLILKLQKVCLERIDSCYWGCTLGILVFFGRKIETGDVLSKI